MTDESFKRKAASVTGLTVDSNSQHCRNLSKLGVNIIPCYTPGKGFKRAVKALKDAQVDAIRLIPPAQKDKLDITLELIKAARQAGIPNVYLLSSVGCDVVEQDKQPCLREFIDIEAAVMATKGEPYTPTRHSRVIIRYDFFVFLSFHFFFL